VVTRQLQVERRTAKVRLSETDVLPLCHATNGDYRVKASGLVIMPDRVRIMCISLQVAVVGERRCGKTSLAESLRRSAAAREGAAAAGDGSTDVDDLAGTGSGWCRLDVVDLSAGRHLDVYGRGLDVDAYILAFDVTSIQAAGSAHHNGTAAALTSRHAARLQMWLQALYEVLLFFLAARCYASAALAVMRCLSVCLSRSYILSKRINISSNVFYHRLATPF